MDVSCHKGNTLWNNNYCLLLLANVLLYMATYALLPALYIHMSDSLKVDSDTAAVITISSGLSLGLFGVFNNYLVDTYKRQHVYICAIIGMAVCTFLYVYVHDVWAIAVLRILHGGCLGVALMVGGSTLAIDIAPGDKRDQANFYFAASGILGTLLGLALGNFFCSEIAPSMPNGFEVLMWLVIATYVFIILSISAIEVCFRAPLNVSLCALDRFLLFRSLLPGLNMLLLPVVIGLFLAVNLGEYTVNLREAHPVQLFATLSDGYIYICMAAGYIVLLSVKHFFSWSMPDMKFLLFGTLLCLFALSSMWYVRGGVLFYASAVLLGFSIGVVMSHFLKIMILLPNHCERGTGFHTFIMLREMGIALGVLLYIYAMRPLVGSPNLLYFYAIIPVVAALLIYLLFTKNYFLRKRHQHHI